MRPSGTLAPIQNKKKTRTCETRAAAPPAAALVLSREPHTHKAGGRAKDRSLRIVDVVDGGGSRKGKGGGTGAWRYLACGDAQGGVGGVRSCGTGFARARSAARPARMPVGRQASLTDR
jgi:hypothetical protein